jgi:hypothetical protein
VRTLLVEGGCQGRGGRWVGVVVSAAATTPLEPHEWVRVALSSLVLRGADIEGDVRAAAAAGAACALLTGRGFL